VCGNVVQIVVARSAVRAEYQVEKAHIFGHRDVAEHFRITRARLAAGEMQAATKNCTSDQSTDTSMRWGQQKRQLGTKKASSYRQARRKTTSYWVSDLPHHPPTQLLSIASLTSRNRSRTPLRVSPASSSSFAIMERTRRDTLDSLLRCSSSASRKRRYVRRSRAKVYV